MRRWLVGVLIGTTCLVVAPPAFGQSSFYNDASGAPPGNSPDTTHIKVTPNPAGIVGFSVPLANRSMPLSGDYSFLFLNTDRNAATGDLGAEYRIYFEWPSGFIVAERWDGATWVFFGVPSLFGYWVPGYGPYFGFNPSELGPQAYRPSRSSASIAAFDFFFIAVNGADSDRAPDTGYFGYPPPPIVGTSAGDVLTGTPGDDVFRGLGGNDTIRGLGGNDLIYGGGGNDRAFGGAGRDRIFGGRGADRLVGGKGRDRLNGGPGIDVCLGARDVKRRCP
jgi:hypothetical protein